jgi:hypothetical protein
MMLSPFSQNIAWLQSYPHAPGIWRRILRQREKAAMPLMNINRASGRFRKAAAADPCHLANLAANSTPQFLIAGLDICSCFDSLSRLREVMPRNCNHHATKIILNSGAADLDAASRKGETNKSPRTLSRRSRGGAIPASA